MSQDPAAVVERSELRRRVTRLRLVMAVFALAFASIGFRLVDILDFATDTSAAEMARTDNGPDPRRAAILDRRGALLATNIETLSVIGDPQKIPDPVAAARRLSENIQGIDKAQLLKRFQRGGRFAWIKRHISPREQKIIQELGIPGIGFQKSEKRVYPNGRMASHILGFVDIDNQGLAGIEFGKQEALVGGKDLGKADLSLALDLRVQMAVRNELAKAVAAFRALGGCAYVMDVESRELVAMASLPDFDPNKPELSPPNARRNRCVGEVYELGSLFKLFTVAMALESRTVSMTDRFNASQPLKIGRHTINDDHAKKRWLTVPEVIAFSSNIGTALMAAKAGGSEAQKLFLERLGLFDKPELEIPGTETPLLPRRWIDIVSATVSYGHGIAVSPLQYGEAVAALIDDGLFERVHILPSENDHIREGEPVVSPTTIDALRWMMWLTVEHGTSTKGKAEGYLVGGKTGTADKVAENGRGYKRNAVISSFLGAFPMDDPRYVVMVSLDEPQGNKSTYGYRYAGWTAAPAVSEIIAAIGPLLNVPPVSPASVEAMTSRLRIMPTINGRTHKEEDGFEIIRAPRQ